MATDDFIRPSSDNPYVRIWFYLLFETLGASPRVEVAFLHEVAVIRAIATVSSKVNSECINCNNNNNNDNSSGAEGVCRWSSAG